MAQEIKTTFKYDFFEIDWHGGATFNVYPIDELGVRDQEIDCFTVYNVKTINEAEKHCDQYAKNN